MKLKFDNNLIYQKQAVDAVVDLFKGQATKQANFTVQSETQVGTYESNTGIGNKLDILDE